MDGPQRYTGAPASTGERLRAWLTPSGGPVLDGARLAAINTAMLLGALMLLGITAILDRLAGWLMPLPLLLPGVGVVLLLAGVSLWVDWRFAHAYARAARLRGARVKPDIFGGVAALPFLALALLLLGTGTLGLFLALVTFSGARLAEAASQLGYGALFAALAAGVVFVARLAGERERA